MILLKLISSIVKRMPLSLALWLGECIGMLAYLAFPTRRKTAMTNLRLAFPEKSDGELKAIAWQMARNMGQNMTEFFRLTLITPQNLGRYVEWSGLEHLESALKHGRGVFILSAHFGNWELMAVSIANKGFTMNLITKYLKSDLLNRFWLETRRKLNINALYREGSLREIIKALKANQVMGFVLDQSTRRDEGVFVDFFGRPACTIPSLAVLAQRLNVPVVPGFNIRKSGGRHCITFDPPLAFETPAQAGLDDAIRHNTQIYTGIIEKYVRQYPAQWIWMHKRWKTQPLEEISEPHPANGGTK